MPILIFELWHHSLIHLNVFFKPIVYNAAEIKAIQYLLSVSVWLWRSCHECRDRCLHTFCPWRFVPFSASLPCWSSCSVLLWSSFVDVKRMVVSYIFWHFGFRRMILCICSEIVIFGNHRQVFLLWWHLFWDLCMALDTTSHSPDWKENKSLNYAYV